MFPYLQYMATKTKGFGWVMLLGCAHPYEVVYSLGNETDKKVKAQYVPYHQE